MTTQSILFDVLGQFPTEPILRVQPTVQRAAPTANVGWKWRRRETITNTGTEPVVNHPYLINLGSTTALVSGGKAQADGDDVRVWQGGVEVARRLKGFNTASSGVWVVIPYLGAGEAITYDIVYGNASAGAGPALSAGLDLAAFDMGGSDNSQWTYLVDRTAANAGKGGWWLSSGTSEPDVRFNVPGAWQLATTMQGDDDRYQEAVTTYVATGTKYMGRFSARRARAGSIETTRDNGADGVSLRVPSGIEAITADIIWTNMAVGDVDDTPVGKVVILTRNSQGESWKTLYSNAALQVTEATIASATYTPPAPVKEIAFAVWPQSGNSVSNAARPDRYVEAKWGATLNVMLDDSILVQSSAQAETEIYELATELRYDGGGDAAGVPPYKSILLGNAKGASGVGTPRLAAKLNEHIVIDTEHRLAEVWNSALTAKVEDVPIPAVSAVDGVRTLAGATVEQRSTEWMLFNPVVNPLTNPSATVNALNWTRGSVTAGLTASALARTTAQFADDTASFTVTINPNTAGSGATVEDIASDFLPVGTRESVQLGVAIRTANVLIQPTPSVWFYDAVQAPLGARQMQADWTIPATNTWYRRLFAVAVPEGAVYYRVGVTGKTKAGSGTTGQYWFDILAPNDSEVALIDVAKGTLVLSAKWHDRHAYA